MNGVGVQSLNLSKPRNNRLRRLPAGIGGLAWLEYLVLNGNELEALPESIVRLRRLKTLRLQANPWGVFPAEQESWLRGLAERGARIRR